MTENILIGITWVAFAIWAWKIGYTKGHGYAGLVLGATLAYVGVIVIALFPKSKTHYRELPTAQQQLQWIRSRGSHRDHGRHAA